MSKGNRIRVLDDITINQIAAGEVIENPSSVVKELIENSLDAEATEIAIELSAGGRQMIRVVDNGVGMSSDDAVLCLERHATSKLSDASGIHLIETMGFRGEALPSIASVSKLTLMTCLRGSDAGTLLISEGGKLIFTGEAARSPGTTVEVKSLFYNTPVRRKFQKNIAVDSREVKKTVTLLALANPDIRFRLVDNQRPVLTLSQGRGESFQERLACRIRDVLGKDFFLGMRPIHIEHDLLTITGFIGVPGELRSQRSGQYIFVQQRPVTDTSISSFISEAFGTLIPSRQFPVFVLHFTFPPTEVDVNVHPQKREVRLRSQDRLRQAIEQAVQQVIGPSSVLQVAPVEEEATLSLQAWSQRVQERGQVSPYVAYNPVVESKEKPQADFFEEKPIVPKVLATMKRYILLETHVLSGDFAAADAVVFVDQHAAHSRILFDTLMSQDKGKNESQGLLFPVTVELSPSESSLLEAAIDFMESLGIGIRFLGGQTFVVDALPADIQSVDIVMLIHDLVEELDLCQKKNAIDREREKRLVLAATRLAVSEKKQLSIEAAQSLIEKLVTGRHSLYAPNGRPIILNLEESDLDVLFAKQKEGNRYGQTAY